MKTLKTLFALIAMLLCCTSIFAHDFEVDGIYYEILSETDKIVEVTYKTDREPGYTSITHPYNGTVTIPESLTYNGITYSVTSIGTEAFYGCSGLTSIEIPNSVTSIGYDAFYGCSGLTSIEIPNSVTSIGSYAFYGCSLKSLTIGTGVLSIGVAQCKPVKTIWLTNTPPSGYEYMQGTVNYTINNQYGLRNVKVYPYLGSTFEVNGVKYVPISTTEKTCDAIDCNYDNPDESIDIGESVSFKGIEMKVQNVMPYTFYGQTSVKIVKIANNGDIGNNAFELCSSLKTMTLGDGVPSIGDRAFKGCGNLEKFSVGKNIKTLGDEVFFDCSSLKEFSCRALPVPTCGNQTFIGIDMWGCTLKIPEGTTSLYQGADQWKSFFFMDDVLECPKFEVVYMIDDEVIATDSIKYGKSITLKDAPVKEGHTFAGWENAPETMPANDITITGSYKVNSYAVKYVIEGKTVATDSVKFGSVINLRDKPVKEGHTFLGWSEAPETMPANDITITGEYKVNTYTVMYVVDGEVIESYPVEYGKELVMMPLAPEKEGHTFMGWSELPATMPAEDVTVTGTFKVNTYAVTYVVDGVTVATDSVVYGTAVTLIDKLEKEGYSFSWSEAPETMPANDITITGEWSINSYLVTYIVDGEVYATDSVEYGAAITLPEVPEKENSTFEWEEVPETMPANDVTIYGNYVSGIGGITVSGKADVYTLNGMLYKRDVDLNKLNIELPKGVYIINGKKFMVR